MTVLIVQTLAPTTYILAVDIILSGLGLKIIMLSIVLPLTRSSTQNLHNYNHHIKLCSIILAKILEVGSKKNDALPSGLGHWFCNLGSLRNII